MEGLDKIQTFALITHSNNKKRIFFMTTIPKKLCKM